MCQNRIGEEAEVKNNRTHRTSYGGRKKKLSGACKQTYIRFACVVTFPNIPVPFLPSIPLAAFQFYYQMLFHTIWYVAVFGAYLYFYLCRFLNFDTQTHTNTNKQTPHKRHTTRNSLTWLETHSMFCIHNTSDSVHGPTYRQLSTHTHTNNAHFSYPHIVQIIVENMCTKVNSDNF